MYVTWIVTRGDGKDVIKGWEVSTGEVWGYCFHVDRVFFILSRVRYYLVKVTSWCITHYTLICLYCIPISISLQLRSDYSSRPLLLERTGDVCAANAITALVRPVSRGADDQTSGISRYSNNIPYIAMNISWIFCTSPLPRSTSHSSTTTPPTPPHPPSSPPPSYSPTYPTAHKTTCAPRASPPIPSGSSPQRPPQTASWS